MKKLLLVSTALAGLTFLSAPASAAVKLDLGGFFSGYGVYSDSREVSGVGSSLHNFEFRRDTEVHVSGETTLDNGLTVGFHTEQKIGNGSSATTTDEVYGYASGGWGRFNLGVEDGSAYLLQVAAPSADSNVDGMRVNIQGVNPITAIGTGTTFAFGSSVFANTNFLDNLDYQQADFRATDRLTFLTPKYNGFQAGVSYAPKPGITSNTGAMAVNSAAAILSDASVSASAAASYKNLWEASARWDGELQGFGLSLGAGYSAATLANVDATAAGVNAIAGANTNAAGDWGLTDGLKTWNGGASVAFSGFTLGGGYKHSQTARITDTDIGAGVEASNQGDITSTTWDAGLGYDNGPYHVGGSYLRNTVVTDALSSDGSGTTVNDAAIAKGTYRTTKYAAGGGYTFAPGMTFRGSLAWGKFDSPGAAATDNKFTQVAVGTDIQF